MLLPMLKYEHEGEDGGAMDVEFIAHHYSTKQCHALEALGDILKVGGEKDDLIIVT